MTSMVLLKRGKNDGIVMCSKGNYFEGAGNQYWISQASISF
jgi:hypothetical protein